MGQSGPNWNSLGGFAVLPIEAIIDGDGDLDSIASALGVSFEVSAPTAEGHSVFVPVASGMSAKMVELHIEDHVDDFDNPGYFFQFGVFFENTHATKTGFYQVQMQVVDGGAWKPVIEKPIPVEGDGISGFDLLKLKIEEEDADEFLHGSGSFKIRLAYKFGSEDGVVGDSVENGPYLPPFM